MQGLHVSVKRISHIISASSHICLSVRVSVLLVAPKGIETSSTFFLHVV